MVYVHLATGFEEVEALTAVDILRRAGIDTEMVSVTGEMKVRGAHGMEIVAGLTFEEADYDSCEMIVLPGGLPGATNLEAHSGLTGKINEFNSQGKKLAAICAAPLVFGTCGLLEGRNATIYPGMEAHLKGGNPTGESVTVDGNIITGKGPALAMEFALTLVEELADGKARNEVASGLLYDRE